jgi:nucleoside-diphosphate-sugar epimerase
LARKLLKWEPTVALDDGLNRTIAYFANMLTKNNQEPAVNAVA